MAIDVGLETGYEDTYGNYYCIGGHREVQWGIDLGDYPTIGNYLVNVNFFLFGTGAEIAAPVPMSVGALPPGYNLQYIADVPFWTQAYLSGSAGPLWENVKFEYQWTTGGDLLDVRIFGLHTMDMRSWIADSLSRDNNSRLWRSKWNDAAEFTITPGTIYDSFVGINHNIGIKVSLYDITDTGYMFVESKVLPSTRNDLYFWNPVSPTDPNAEWPYSPVKAYTWSLTRNSIPVNTLSTTQDTQVKLTLELHTGSDIDEYYWVGLVAINPPGPNAQQYFQDLPMAYGVWNGSYGQETLPYQLNGVNIIDGLAGFTEVTPDVWEVEFDVKKEAITPGLTYRLYVIAKNLWNAPPV